MNPFPSPRKSYFALSSFYYFDFAALGFLLPYFPLYLQSLGMNKWQIGLLLSIIMITRVGIPILWARFSDKSGKGYEILIANTYLSTALLAFLPFVKSFEGILAVLFLSLFFRTSLLPLVDAMSLKLITFTKSSYGFIRVWGSLGFLSASLLGGVMISLWGIRIVPAMLIFTFFASSLALTFLDKEEPSHLSPKIARWRDLLQRNFLALLIAGLLMQTSHSAYYEYFSIYMKQEGSPTWVIGILWSVAIGAEMGMMLTWKRWDEGFSTWQILFFSYGMAVLRWTGLAYFTSFWSIALLQTFHAFSFASFHLANMYWIKRNVSFANQSTAQALYSSLVFGLGGVFGFMGAGKLTEYTSLPFLFKISAGIAFVALLLFAFAYRKRTINLIDVH